MPLRRKRPADEIERAIGERVRILRMSSGMTQGKVAEALGVTGQQIQKYERGDNRISAGKLWMLSQILGVDVRDFFDNLEDTVVESEVEANEQVWKAAGALRQINDVRLRERLLELIRACNDDKIAEASD